MTHFLSLMVCLAEGIAGAWVLPSNPLEGGIFLFMHYAHYAHWVSSQ